MRLPLPGLRLPQEWQGQGAPPSARLFRSLLFPSLNFFVYFTIYCVFFGEDTVTSFLFPLSSFPRPFDHVRWGSPGADDRARSALNTGAGSVVRGAKRDNQRNAQMVEVAVCRLTERRGTDCQIIARAAKRTCATCAVIVTAIAKAVIHALFAAPYAVISVQAPPPSQLSAQASVKSIPLNPSSGPGRWRNSDGSNASPSRRAATLSPASA